MDLSTNAPGLQFYSGNFLNGSVAGKGAYLYPQHSGFAMESQVTLPVLLINLIQSLSLEDGKENWSSAF